MEDLKKKIADLEFENSVLLASVQGQPEPKRVLDETCPGCKKKLIAGRDPRVAICETKDCKVRRVLR